MLKQCKVIVRGRVQLVMYRDFAERKARGLGIVGSVKNLPDGTVEVIAEGDEVALTTYLDKLRRGSLLSRVEQVDIEWREPTNSFTTFTILF